MVWSCKLSSLHSARQIRGGVLVPHLARVAEELVLNAIEADASSVEALLFVLNALP